MTIPDFGSLAAGLRAWAEGDRVSTAAVELLIWRENWLRRADFLAACTDTGGGMTCIRWDDARKFAGSSPACSPTELAVLRLAVAIGSDEYLLSAMGRAHGAAVVQAFAIATRSEGILRG